MMMSPDAKFHENCFDGFHFRWISIFPVPETRAPGQDLFPQFKAPKNANRILKLSIYTNLSLVKTKINLFCLKYYLQNLPPGGHLLISSIVFKSQGIVLRFKLWVIFFICHLLIFGTLARCNCNYLFNYLPIQRWFIPWFAGTWTQWGLDWTRIPDLRPWSR